MFTGIIEQMGILARRGRGGGKQWIEIRHAPWDSPLVKGESVCVQGVCLTVAALSSDRFTCDVLDETLARSTLGLRREGAWVNLERAVRADGRLGGHVVSGHVDGTGVVRAVARRGHDIVLEVGCGDDLLLGMVRKGSIAIDGVSLTIASLGAQAFSVRIIPVTWSQTTLGGLQSGERVNLETDVLGKFASRQLEGRRAEGLSEESLRRAGFMSDLGA